MGKGRKYGRVLVDIKAAAMTWGIVEDRGRQNYLSSSVYWHKPLKQTIYRMQVLF